MHLSPSDRPSASQQIDDEEHDCDDDQQVDKAAADVADQTDEPQNEQDYNYGPQYVCHQGSSHRDDTLTEESLIRLLPLFVSLKRLLG
jgi:hypothetical protein